VRDMTDITRPLSWRSHEIDEDDLSRQILWLDALARNPAVQGLRAWATEALAPKIGDSAADIGSGTGETVQVLAAAVAPTGDAVGIESNPGMRAEAHRCAEAAGSTARFADGEADALPIEATSVDLVWCERVFQHLDRPDRAAREIGRV
jgi:ubiquinone/menaquinone biosynthesis C-methylase UbiE